MERGYNEGRTGGLLKSIGTLCREHFKTAEPIEMPFRIWTPVGLRLSSVTIITIESCGVFDSSSGSATWKSGGQLRSYLVASLSPGNKIWFQCKN